MSEKGMLDQAFTNNPEGAMKHVLDSAASHAQKLVDLQQRAQDAEEQLNTDDKSNLATERKWRTDLEKTAESLDENDHLLVMIGDVNGFKPVNDTLGHDAGDELLGLLGKAFRNTFRRESDSMARGNRDEHIDNQRGSIARLGGDEFSIYTIVKPGEYDGHERYVATGETVKLQSTRLNKQISKMLEGTKYEEFNISIALGGVEYDPTIDRSVADTFVRADAAMYAIKYAGKLEQITQEDIEELQRIVPYMEGLGARIEPWLKEATYQGEPTD